jgi:hypothetical protein
VCGENESGEENQGEGLHVVQGEIENEMPLIDYPEVWVVTKSIAAPTEI